MYSTAIAPPEIPIDDGLLLSGEAMPVRMSRRKGEVAVSEELRGWFASASELRVVSHVDVVSSRNRHYLCFEDVNVSW